MVLTFLFQTPTTLHQPAYFMPIFVGMFLAGAIAWLVAAVLGFARARAFGPSARWFSLASVCLLLFHLQFLAAAFGILTADHVFVVNLLAFFNFFILVAAGCAIMGFIRLTSPR